MKLALAILIAYAVTGLYCVCRDLSEKNSTKVTGFILYYQTRGGWGYLLGAALAWLPATLISMYWKPSIAAMRRDIFLLVFFLFVLLFVRQISN